MTLPTDPGLADEPPSGHRHVSITEAERSGWRALWQARAAADYRRGIRDGVAIAAAGAFTIALTIALILWAVQPVAASAPVAWSPQPASAFVPIPRSAPASSRVRTEAPDPKPVPPSPSAVRDSLSAHPAPEPLPVSYRYASAKPGIMSWYSLDPAAVAWPGGRGWRLRVCGARACLVLLTTDAGPDRAMQRAGRILDVSAPTFEALSGMSRRYGLARVTVQVLGRVA